MVPVIIFALIVGGIALALLAAFAVVVASIHGTDRRMSLRDPRHAGAADVMVRRLLGVYVRQPGHPGRGAGREDQAVHCGQARR